MRTYWVYILASRRRVLYIGVTNNLNRRLCEHRSGAGSRFVARYNVFHLVYAESGNRIVDLIAREKEIKRWRREKKIALIERTNPEWKDLSPVPTTTRSLRRSAPSG